jgi:chorismate mutase
LRKEIDEIDERILHFLKDRVEICKTVGAIKRENGIPIRDQQREEEQYRNVMKRASELGLDPHEVKAVYREIIAMSMHVQ